MGDKGPHGVNTPQFHQTGTYEIPKMDIKNKYLGD